MRRFVAGVLVLAVAVATLGVYISRPPNSTTAGNCSVANLSAMQDTISQQTAALANENFSRALVFASESFRERVTDSAFAVIISSDYNFLLSDPGISITSCDRVDEQFAQVSVAFTTGDSLIQMGYFMVFEGGGWFIDSAFLEDNAAVAA